MRTRRGRTAVTAAIALLIIGALVGCSAKHPGTKATHTPLQPAPVDVVPMPTASFWKIIDAARGTTDPRALSARPSALKRQLQSLSPTDLEGFALTYDDTMLRLDRWKIWDAGYAAAQGMGDDDFDYFRAWLIGKGQTVVSEAESDPDGLVKYVTQADWSRDGFENESLDYVADDLLTQRIGEKADETFDERALAHVDDVPPGHQTSENTINKRYPLLATWAKKHDH